MTNVRVVHPGCGEVLRLGPSHVSVLIASDDTAEVLALVEEHLPAGPGSPPPHVHRSMDHTFYVTSGIVRFTAGTDTVEVASGGAVFVPRGISHTFENASEVGAASFIEFDGPGRFDSYFRELSALLDADGFVVERIRDLQARYDTWPPA